MEIALALLVALFAVWVEHSARRETPEALVKVEDECEYQWNEYAACIARQSNPHN